VDKQAVDMENAMKRLSEQHREKVALYEKQHLQQKHQLKRGAKRRCISSQFLSVTTYEVVCILQGCNAPYFLVMLPR